MQTSRKISRYEPTWESLLQYSVPQWFSEAKLGIFIHWGVYSVPAFDNEWYSRNMYLRDHKAFAHHQQTWGEHTKFGYKDFVPMFKGEKFDPAAWIDLFKKAGARYVVPVAEHHDGFAMYDTALSEWNAVKMGPKRDVIGEIAKAAKEQGLIFGVSHHRAEHWWFFNGGREFDSDVQDPHFADFYGPPVKTPNSIGKHDSEIWKSRDWTPRPDAKFLEEWLVRCCELVDKYQPQIVYFDWWIEQLIFQPYLQRFASHYYNRGVEWDKGLVISYKFEAFPKGAAVFNLERGKLTDIYEAPWQADTSVSYQSWCYVEKDDFKTAATLVHTLADVVSKNGTLLLNVGPKPDGTLTAEAVDSLTQIGAWLNVNGEAIYETRPWHVFGEGTTKLGIGHLQERGDQPFTADDYRFTTKTNALYVIRLGWSSEPAKVHSMSSTSALKADMIDHIQMLGSDEALEWSQNADCLQISTPSRQPCDHAFTYKITLKKGSTA